MKKILTIFFVVAAFNSKAQMQTLFFNEDESRGKNIADSILSVLTGFKTDTAYQGKSEKSTTIILHNNNDEKVVIRYSAYNKKIYLCSITGKFEFLFAVYTRYINANATREQLIKNNCAQILLIQLPQKNELPISFCNNGKSWTIRTTLPN